MARNQTLDRIVQLVRAEAGHFTSASAGINMDETIRVAVSRTYEALAREHDWPHLIETFEIPLAAGQFAYGIPAGADPDRLIADDAHAYYVSDKRRYPVCCEDITWQHKNERDPTVLAERLDPVRIWTRAPDDRIEVWPTPATDNNGTLYLKAHRLVTPLVAGADLCRLDDRMVSLFVAAEMLGADRGRPKLSQAQALLGNLKGSLNPRRSFNMLGSDGRDGPAPRRVEVVYTRAV
jgi:hypothetical protein